MGNPWFRLYAEFATDPKVQMLSEADQRRFIMLLCIRCSNDNETFHDDEVAFQLRISNDEWERTKAVLQQKNMIDHSNKPIHWDRRQFVSDSSAARVRKHREAVKRECNVTVTTPDTDTDTESDKEKRNINTAISQSQQLQTEPIQTAKPKKTYEPCLITKRNHRLTGKRLDGFNRFWDAFNDKRGKAEAAEAWFQLNGYTDSLVDVIVEKAAEYADARKDILDRGSTPRWHKDG